MTKITEFQHITKLGVIRKNPIRRYAVISHVFISGKEEIEYKKRYINFLDAETQYSKLSKKFDKQVTKDINFLYAKLSLCQDEVEIMKHEWRHTYV